VVRLTSIATAEMSAVVSAAGTNPKREGRKPPTGALEQDSEEERSSRGPVLVVCSNTDGKTAMMLETSKIQSGDRQG